MNLRFPTRQRLRGHSQAWLDRHPGIADFLHRTGCMSMRREALARGIAVGLFIGLTPTVGFQTMLMVAGCMMLRGNFPVAFLISWISNPITMGPLYFAFAVLGDAVFGDFVRSLVHISGLLADAALQTIYLGLGSLLVAVPTAAVGYLLSLAIWRALAVRRWRARALNR